MITKSGLRRENSWSCQAPSSSTFKAGATTDTVLEALGQSFPVGLSPFDNVEEKEQVRTEYFPASVTEEPILNVHAAIMLTCHA